MLADLLLCKRGGTLYGRQKRPQTYLYMASAATHELTEIFVPSTVDADKVHTLAMATNVPHAGMQCCIWKKKFRFRFAPVDGPRFRDAGTSRPGHVPSRFCRFSPGANRNRSKAKPEQTETEVTIETNRTEHGQYKHGHTTDNIWSISNITELLSRGVPHIRLLCPTKRTV